MTHDEYIQKLAATNNGTITCIDIYAGSNVEINHFCHTCKRILPAKPSSFTRKRASSCRLCNNDRVQNEKRTPEQYNKELDALHNGIVFAREPYISRKKPISHGCSVCEHTWKTLPANVLNGSGCPACANALKNKILRKTQALKTHDEYLHDLSRIHFDSIRPIATYQSSATPCQHQCTVCDHIWYPKPGRLLEGRGCPQCNQSKGEKYIGHLLKTWQTTYETEKTFNDLIFKQKLRFDFYVPEHNLLIEYDGEQHFRAIKHFGGDASFKRVQQRDRLKNKYAAKHGFTLIRIPYSYTRDKIEAVLADQLLNMAN